MKRIVIFSMVAMACLGAFAKKNQPNIIYILADDMGYGDLSCYGQKDFETPNIDRLATQGMKFTDHYCGSTVCAPSRSTLMTGLHTGHTPIRGNKELKGQEGQTPMPAKYLTVAEILKDAGYATGAFGKWGLGFIGSEGDAINQGFDVFYGYNCQRMAHRYYPPYLWNNDEKDFLEGNDWIHTVTYAPDVVQEHALQFIEQNKDKPFFAYVPLIQPHAELIAPDDSILKKFMGRYEEPPFDQKIRDKASDYGPDMEHSKYCYQEYPKAVFAAMIYRIDVYVGQILDKLDQLGIANNTVVMFASDNGPHDAGGANPKYFNSAGGLRGIKRDLYEGGIRTPFIVKWPGKVDAGSTSHHVSAFWDVLPTFAEIAGAKVTCESDGISFLPTLLGKKKQKQHQYLYWEFASKGGRQAVRMGNWKGVWYDRSKNATRTMELYDLSNDWAESNDLARQHPEIIAQMKQIIAKEHVDSDVFPFKVKK